MNIKKLLFILLLISGCAVGALFLATHYKVMLQQDPVVWAITVIKKNANHEKNVKQGQQIDLSALTNANWFDGDVLVNKNGRFMLFDSEVTIEHPAPSSPEMNLKWARVEGVRCFGIMYGFVGKAIEMSESPNGLAQWYSALRMESEGGTPSILRIRNEKEAFEALGKVNDFCKPYEHVPTMDVFFVGL